MHKILVVDDEPGYRDFLQLHLSYEGYAVRTASTGREAIDMGVRSRPHILIADWLLTNHLHGLRVAEALRVVEPGLRTLLITGFSSRDLQVEAQKHAVYAFIEKPFDLETLLHTVAEASVAIAGHPPPLPVAVLEVDMAGMVHFANASARRLFTHPMGGQHVTHLQDILDDDTYLRLNEASMRWIEFSPRRLTSRRWQLRRRDYPDTQRRLLVMFSECAKHLATDPVILALLDLPVPSHLGWPYNGPVLIMDDYEAHRLLALHQLDLVGCVCHTAATPDEGVRLLTQNPAISVVIMADNRYVTEDVSISQLIQRLKTLRPEIPIVGTSALPRQASFAALGVPRFLLKPWKPSELLHVLT